MRPLKRHPVSKRHSASKFRRNVRRTKAPNMRAVVMRGGIRF